MPNDASAAAPELRVAVFVKTPGLSPLKTRLAGAIGEAEALAFYRLACAAVAAVLRQAQRLTRGRVSPYWAVAEAAGCGSWSGFPVITQGEGELGHRLDHVYRTLYSATSAPALVGADAPQLSVAILQAAWTALATAPFVIGPAADGGFYLFAGRQPLPPEIWTSVAYSQSGTAQALVAKLAPLGSVAWLSPLTDVDHVEDLSAVACELRALSEPLPEQRALQDWLAQRGL